MESFGLYKSDLTGSYYFVVGRTKYDITAEMRAHDAKMTDKAISLVKQIPERLCSVCNQGACAGGMVGSMQECFTVRALSDITESVIGDLKEGK